jgi:predicted RNase H-like HicB family nuclease
VVFYTSTNKKGSNAMLKTASKAYNTARRGVIMPTVINVRIHPCEDDVSGYWAESVTIPGAFTQGETIQETEQHMYESVALLLEDDHPEITEYSLSFEVCDA